MGTDGPRSAATLAARREALVALCAQQRTSAALEIESLAAPLSPGGLRHCLGTHMKIPLTIAGVVLGMIATKPTRALPMLTAGLSLWKLARSVLSVLRKQA